MPFELCVASVWRGHLLGALGTGLGQRWPVDVFVQAITSYPIGQHWHGGFPLTDPGPSAHPDVEGSATSAGAVLAAAIFSTEALILGPH